MLERDVLSFILKYSSRPASDSEFNALALRVFAHQFRKNANYRKFCEIDDSTPANVKRWQDVPAMPAAGFKELVLASFPSKRAKRVFRTSGTTRGESRGAHFFETLKFYDAAIFAPFKRHVLGEHKRLRFYFLMHSPKDAPDSSLSYMMGRVNTKFSMPKGRFYVKRGEILNENLAQGLASEKKPALLLATAFSLKAFLDYLRQGKMVLRLPAGSRLMETGGFKGRAGEVSKAELYRLCDERLGIKHFVSEYGMTELSSQFYCVHPSKLFRAPAWMRTIAVDPDTGREAAKGGSGVLRHFDLANIGSVAAVQTEDLGRLKDGGFEFLGRAKGAELRGCSLTYEEFIRS